MRTCWLVALVACAALLPSTTTAAPPVKVDGGSIQGVAAGDLTVYKGVPFAAAPVGDLRWKAPQPVSGWAGARAADKYAPACVQSMGGAPPSGMSEDCLYLNVWTPAKAATEKLPVLVWIYGGGFNGGATSYPVHDGAKLASRGVVLVTVAYRVGVLGFFAHPGLSAESSSHTSGNYGLLDMIAGLQWISRNIAAFGGDPKRVTIFGESAGGIAVSMLSASPLAHGLFHGAISQSGGSFGPSSQSPQPGENMRPIAAAEASGVEFAKAAGATSIKELRALTPEKLLEAQRGQRGMAWPIVDGYVIPDDQYKLYEAGRFNDTPILVGYNSDEGLSFTRVKTADEYAKGVRERYGLFADRLLAAYPASGGAVTKTARDLARDSAFGWHTWSWARLQSARGKGKAFSYYFDQHPPRTPGAADADHGSPHGVDVPYVFENLEGSPTAADRHISETMAGYWTNFAKHGDPNGAGLPAWPAFSDANPVVMYLGPTVRTGPVPSADSLKVLDQYFAWRRTAKGASAPATDPAPGSQPAAALDHTRVKNPAVRGEQAPPATPGQNNFGGPITGPGGQRPPAPPRPPEPKLGTVSLDEISMSDPFVYADEKSRTYYLIGSGGRLYKSQDLKMWTGPYSVIDLEGTWMKGRFVAAAEIHHIGGKFYLAGTWNDHNYLIENIPRRYNVPTNQTQLLVADSPDGPFKPLVPQFDFCLGPGNWDIIDGTLYEEDGTPYMVFVHEWTQIIDGTMAYMPLSKDLTRRTAEPTTIFRASEAEWSKEMNSIGEATFGLKMPGWVTDGPQLFRTRTGKLGMLWASWGEHRYAQGVAYSTSGSIKGPWVQEKDAFKGDNSGHGMLFTTFEGKRLFIIHHAEGQGPRKPQIWNVDDSGDKLVLKDRY
jgi:para-nitrobenzyl esterase